MEGRAETPSLEAQQMPIAPPTTGAAPPAPTQRLHRAALTRDGVHAPTMPRGDAQPAMTPTERTPAPDKVSSRPSPAMTPDTVASNDFGKMVEPKAADVAAAALDSGPAAGELLPQSRTDPLRNAPPAPGAPASQPAPVSARPGEIGHQLGVEIVRHGLDGRDSMTIRLDPVEMGEIQIRLQFDDRGTMRAIVTAESSAALEMLRRDSADLVRALGDAGVRTDAQSFQFEGRGQGRGEQQQHGRPQTPSDPNRVLAEAEDDGAAPPQRLHTSGQLDLIA
ncbi:flagellar hook-length control protein FliK [Alteriqipengyuania lutimaris]|uniref:flagellar hook-length control protein FliK n=1 Tax=Alteriqipengyuania lutimaris TaxID=1538146 RepID=UPI0015F15764|nr:flagellar hook-length control protein FliK [Alteriqipengyuania lutimaris]MBB3032473.1 flagellar hook-length control protein FliK [Alteriqipengyuania lutimaris]